MNPTPEQVKQARVKAGLTQQKAADLINCGIRSWQKWEAGDRKMHPAMWELFNIKAEKLRDDVFQTFQAWKDKYMPDDKD